MNLVILSVVEVWAPRKIRRILASSDKQLQITDKHDENKKHFIHGPVPVLHGWRTGTTERAYSGKGIHT